MNLYRIYSWNGSEKRCRNKRTQLNLHTTKAHRRTIASRWKAWMEQMCLRLRSCCCVSPRLVYVPSCSGRYCAQQLCFPGCATVCFVWVCLFFKSKWAISRYYLKKKCWNAPMTVNPFPSLSSRHPPCHSQTLTIILSGVVTFGLLSHIS